MRIVYMGTPYFASQILQYMHNQIQGQGFDDMEIVAVYSQPDRQAGRGKKLQEPETKILAKELNIPVYQPLSFRNNEEALEELKALKPDVLVVAAYGMLLPQAVLDVPTQGAFNVHASLLPQYRGAAPVQRGIIAGDKLTGITIMRMEAGLDTGPILLQQAFPIHDAEDFAHNSGTLLHDLSEVGGQLMMSALKMIKENRVSLVAQIDELATLAPKLSKQEAIIDWAKSAEEIHCHIRGFSPNPGATASLIIPQKENIAVRIEQGYPLDRLDFQAPENKEEIPTGTIFDLYDKYLVVKCGTGFYGISQIRLAGKAPMDAKAFNNGYLKNYGSLSFVLKENLETHLI